jgi:lipoate-protein ligase A
MSVPEHWRLIVDPPRDGPANMALDEAILESVARGDSLPTLRLYRWQVACLSLGYAQPAVDADRKRIAARDWDLVRRMTGGRAILHADELTYSVTLPIQHPLAAGWIVESYRRLSGALLAALRALDLDAGADKRAEPIRSAGPICFELPSDYEITVNGKKLIGSAQVRKQGGLLQHGSLPLSGDLGRICEALAFASETERQIARERVFQRATTFAGASGRLVNWETAAEAVASAFAETFGLIFESAPPSPAETRRAETLRLTRYAADDWTLRL